MLSCRIHCILMTKEPLNHAEVVRNPKCFTFLTLICYQRILQPDTQTFILVIGGQKCCQLLQQKKVNFHLDDRILKKLQLQFVVFVT